MGEDAVREERILMEDVVDAYGTEERAMGWYYYLADKILFPFVAECFVIDKRSPLVSGERVTILQIKKFVEVAIAMKTEGLYEVSRHEMEIRIYRKTG